jgi:CheY-like chemotaxis protein
VSRCILVVEDDPDILDTVGELLRAAGYSVLLACDGDDALDQLHAARELPDLIFLDLMMPVKDGVQFRLEQRADARLRDIPVVIMSADTRMDTHRDQLAARGYIRKPFDRRTILQAAAS